MERVFLCSITNNICLYVCIIKYFLVSLCMQIKHTNTSKAMNSQNRSVEKITDQFLAVNGGYLKWTNVMQINRLKYLGREKFTATKTCDKSVATRIVDGKHISAFCAIHSMTTLSDLERDVYQAPAGMSGVELKESVIILKLNTMNTMTYFEAKDLAKQLSIENYSRMKKDELFSALETEKARREELKAQQKPASSYPKIDNGYSVGQLITFTDKKGQVSIGTLTKVCPKMVEFREDGTERLRWAYYPEIAAVTSEEELEPETELAEIAEEVA
jgi:hypothetical protein